MSNKTKIVLGADHAGFALKEKVRAYLASKGYEVDDQGPMTSDPVDYPDLAEKVATRVATKAADYGVLMCGTGLGMAITANKVNGVRAATCNDTLSAHFARAHNNANVLTMGGRLVDDTTAQKILDVWLATPFDGGRHARRVDKIAALDQKYHAEKS
ncbi:MAG: ribose 5-phosphate isomerase B [Terriglobia bacterium]